MKPSPEVHKLSAHCPKWWAQKPITSTPSATPQQDLACCLASWDGRDGPFPVFLLHHRPALLVMPSKDLSNQKVLMVRGARGHRESTLLYLPCGCMPWGTSGPGGGEGSDTLIAVWCLSRGSKPFCLGEGELCKVSTGKRTPMCSGYKLKKNLTLFLWNSKAGRSQLLPGSGHQQPQPRCQLNSREQMLSPSKSCVQIGCLHGRGGAGDHWSCQPWNCRKSYGKGHSSSPLATCKDPCFEASQRS